MASTTKTNTTRRPCKAIAKSGKPCQAFAVHGSDFCFAHDPTLARERAAARKRGGKARHGRVLKVASDSKPPAALATHGDMLDALEFALEVALALEPSHNQVRSIVAVVTAAAKIHEVGEIEQRLDAIEQLLKNPLVTVRDKQFRL